MEKILQSVAIQTILEARLDGMVNCVHRLHEGKTIPPTAETAHGDKDEKGLFFPRYLFFNDSKGRRIAQPKVEEKPISTKQFRKQLLQGMQKDSAHLVGKDGILLGRGIKNDYAAAGSSLRERTAYDTGQHMPLFSRRKSRYTFDDIVLSLTPKYAHTEDQQGNKAVEGEKTHISSLVAHWMSFPMAWHEKIIAKYELEGPAEERLYDYQRKMFDPIKSAEGDLLWEPMGVTVHAERKTTRNLVGPIRITNYTKEYLSFHTITFEKPTATLEKLADTPLSQDHILYEEGKIQAVGVIRYYGAPRLPGTRPDSKFAHFIHPNELTFDVEKVVSNAKKSYF